MANSGTTEKKLEGTAGKPNPGLLFSILIIIGIGILLAIQVIETGGKTASEIRNASIAAQESVYSCSYNSTSRTDSTGVMDGSPMTINGSVFMKGRVDLNKKFTYSYISSDIEVFSGKNFTREQRAYETYIVNTTLYTGAEGVWMKQDLGEDVWSGMTLQQEVDVINDTNVRLVGTEDVLGEKAYVLEFKPDLAVLMVYANEIGGKMPSFGERLSGESVRDYTIKEWVSTETLLPLKSVNVFTLTSEDINTTMTVISEYYDYDKPVNTQLPEAAASAIQVQTQ
jgi:hypothetical protein